MSHSEQGPIGEPPSRSIQILNNILGYLNNREGFRRGFDRIEGDVVDELMTTLNGIIEEKLGDTKVLQEQKSTVIVEAVIYNLSDRKGLRQDFFDQLFFDDEAVKKYLEANPDVEVSEDDSRSGIARQLIQKIEPLIQ